MAPASNLTTLMPLPERSQRFAAVFLKGHAKMMSLGMTHSKLSQTAVMRQIGGIVGKTYKRGQINMALEDITNWLKENPDG